MTKDRLAVALIQTDLYWENVTANLSSLEEKIAAIEKPADVIILPEMFNSGFTMNRKVAEPVNLTTTRWMKQIAEQTDALIIGSFAVKDGDEFYNRLFYVFPDGTFSHSDKRHLFRMGEEHETYTPGNSKKIIDWRGWKICALVCYDLRFPVWSRNIESDQYDLLVYVANWPARRAHAWKSLLIARAIENQSYVVGVNRVGTDALGISYQGDSVAHDFLGEPICILENKEQDKVVDLSQTDLKNYRKGFPAYLDADTFNIL
ncbi:amidohydrolase [Dyadobacter sp. NIV53]|uniref:amidohydrolase n=1 Tax=Dyadobacter sp. NIV53 TaxID=2861765 RepID=UPI001C887FAE|nr:amidohydrolase [Dyadobacter sp. NIV53]